MALCDICVEPLINQINCPNCEFIACNQCYERYIIENTQKCMKCGTEFPDEFINTQFSSQFVNGSLKNKKFELFINDEQLKIQDTEDKIELTKRITKLTQQKETLKGKIQYLPFDKEEFDEITKIREEIRKKRYYESELAAQLNEELKTKMENRKCANPEVIEQINRIEDVLISLNANISEDKKDKHNRLIRCAGCINGVLNDKMICKLCGILHCNRCQKVYANKTHKCDPKDINHILTLAHIEQMTKPCPKCSSPIEKNGGCDHMFCTFCKSHFSWSTGAISNVPVFNPHYIEFLRTQNREQNREQKETSISLDCNGFITMEGLAQFLNTLSNDKIKKEFRNRFQLLSHINEFFIPHYQNNPVNLEQIRQQLVIGKINNKVWLAKLKEYFKFDYINRQIITNLNECYMIGHTILKEMIDFEKPKKLKIYTYSSTQHDRTITNFMLSFKKFDEMIKLTNSLIMSFSKKNGIVFKKIDLSTRF